MSTILPNQKTQPAERNSPSIFRFITEYRFSTENILHLKLLVISFFSGLLLIGITFQLLQLLQNVQTLKFISRERTKIAEEISYWKGVSTQYDGYRDAYFKLATLEYKMGNTTQSKQYMEKIFELDPNFEAGRVLGEQIKKK